MPTKAFPVKKGLEARQRRRKLVTLIAAVRCDDGIAICADSQETVGEYRRTVQKIAPLAFGNCYAVVAGAGNADLIEAFITFLRKRHADVTFANIADFVAKSESALKEFYETVVSLSQANYKVIRLFLSASIPSTGEFDVWTANESWIFTPLVSSALIGWDEELYWRSLEKMSIPSMPLPHAVLVGIHTLTIAEETSNSVRGPMAVSIVSNRGIYMEPAGDVKAVGDRMKQYEEQISKLFLLYSDVTTSSIKFKTQLEEFSRAAISLRESHVKAEYERLFASGFDSSKWPYPKLPKGVTVTHSNTGEIKILQGEARIAHYRRHGIDIAKMSLEDMRRIEWNASDPGADGSDEADEEKLP